MRPFGTYAQLGASLVAVVELLLLAVVTDVVVGAGYPYFKVCNTFAQIGAALADAAPAWLCALGTTRRRAQQASRRVAAAPARASAPAVAPISPVEIVSSRIASSCSARHIKPLRYQ